MYDYSTIKALTEDFPSIYTRLASASLVVLFTAIEELSTRGKWYYSVDTPYPITDTQWDEVEEWLDTAQRELMTNRDIGSIRPYATAMLPFGVLACDGSTYAREDYPELYGLLDAAFIVDADFFRTPDLRGCVIVGAGTSHPMGEVGGAETVTLSEVQMPVHNHSIGGSATALAVAPGELPVLIPSILPGSTGYAGSGAAHDNMQPYVSIVYGMIAR